MEWGVRIAGMRCYDNWSCMTKGDSFSSEELLNCCSNINKAVCQYLTMGHIVE